jgi:hypothetical protein
MRDSAIRTTVAARSAPIAAAALFKRTVQIWNWNTGQRLSEIETVFDFGGHRLTISPTGDTVFAASWKKGKKGGVACYDSRSGEQIWQRTDLRQVGGLRFSAQSDIVWCEIGRRPLHRLDAKTGSTVETLRGILDAFDSPLSPHRLHIRKTDFQIIGSRTIRVPKLTFGLLDAGFGPDSLCLSEAGGPVRCLDLEGGNERWRYVPPADHHVLELSSQAGEFFYGVQWEYEHGGPVTLIRLSRESGACSTVCHLHSYPDACSFGPGVIVTSSGDVVSLSDGSVIRPLVFPTSEYPDPEPS